MMELLTRTQISVLSGRVKLEGVLDLPDTPIGMVLFAHGSGSSRHSPRNRFVARHLNAAGFATLLIDLLTSEEDADYETRFDIDLLTMRLADTAHFLGKDPRAAGLKLGLFGASTGAAAALRVAAKMPEAIAAVVSRGGRPDLAGADQLCKVTSPTLLIVGEHDYGVIGLNEQAYAVLTCVRRMEIVPRATHLFEERGALDEVAKLAAKWFDTHLR